MADIERASEVLSILAEKIAVDTGRSALVIVANDDGSVVGACVADHELLAMAGQLRALADELAERGAAQLN